MDNGTIINKKLKNRNRPLNLLVQAIEEDLKETIPNKEDEVEIVCLTSFPPRECGIASYSKDLTDALVKKFNNIKIGIIPLESGEDKFSYPFPIKNSINTDNELDYFRISNEINSNPKIALVLIQHEFGLFKGNENAFLEFLEYLNKPIALTFHTVLPDPTTELIEKVARIGSLCESIIVMTKTSAGILERDYGLPGSKIHIISHGTHLVSYEDKEFLKDKYQLTGKTVLGTFGLLGPNKSIETTLDALPEVVSKYPDTVFLIMGKTHPVLFSEEGERYREFLEARISELGLTEHVRFVNQFIPLKNLLEYLQLTDIYLFTSKDPNQAVSGTFVYALSCGCPILSTPIPHSLEVLQNGAGALFDFEDSDQLKTAIIQLLDNGEERYKMSLNGLHTSSASSWENTAIAHARVFEKILDRTGAMKYGKPPIDLKHLKRMTTEMGIIQFSKINRPDIESGYTLDDNARALIAVCQHYELKGDLSDLKYIRIYFNFVYSCFRHDGRFLNYVDKEYKFTDQNETVNLEDACGRAIWALGYFLSISKRLPDGNERLIDKAKFVFTNALNGMDMAHSTRAMAFVIKGLYFYNLFEEGDCVNKAVIKYADRLVSMYKDHSDDNWQWFEGYLTYGNSAIPHSLLMAYSMTLKPEYRKIAKASFDFLLSKIFIDGTISVISNDNWHQKGQDFNSEFKGGQQPIDVAYTILALRFFHKIFPQEEYYSLKKDAFDWFMGKNALHQTVYNPCTGGCYDGLELNNINLNQGAESTISYILSRLAFENLGK